MTGIPAAGKTTMAEYLSERMHLPVFSKDTVKELLYDHVGFHSRKEKVNLGIAGKAINEGRAALHSGK